nr:immunoglobulin light chain junction region [Macaca mulatta]
VYYCSSYAGSNSVLF